MSEEATYEYTVISVDAREPLEVFEILIAAMLGKGWERLGAASLDNNGCLTQKFMRKIEQTETEANKEEESKK